MIKESYLANWRKIPEDAVKIAVTRTSGSVLSPSWSLLKSYKSGELDWSEFEKRFRVEIESNSVAMDKLQSIKAVSRNKDVYLVCYEKSFPCHRFILLKILEGLK